MVVGTANVKHVAKIKKETEDREKGLAKWMREKEERKKNLANLHQQIRTNSLHSNDSRAPPMPYLPDGELHSNAGSRRGSSVTGSRKNSLASTNSWKGAAKMAEAKRSPSEFTLSSVSVSDTQEIVGGGKKRRSACANCTIM